MEGYVQGALPKELLVAPFVEHFKAATLGKSSWYILLVPGTIYQAMTQPIFGWDF